MLKRRFLKGKFCSRPFEWFEIQTRKAYLCCSGWITTGGMAIEDKSVKELWNSPLAQEFRSSILDGSFRYCKKEECPFMNQHVTRYWEKSGPPFKDKQDIADPRLKRIIEKQLKVLDHGPVVLNCGYDRTCNLNCVTCRPQRIALGPEDVQKELIFQHRIIQEIGPGLELLYVSGTGDPFASQVYRNLLQGTSLAQFPNLEIHLNTNAVLWTSENWDAMAGTNAKITTAHISVDAVAEDTYLQNRRSGNWQALGRNLNFISGLRRKGPLRFVSLSFVVQENNFRQMPDFIRMTRDLGFDLVYFHKLCNWGTFTPQEYDRRSVHKLSHLRHHEFLRILKQDVFNQPDIGLYCLYPYRLRALKLRRWGGLGLSFVPLVSAFLRFAMPIRDFLLACARIFKRKIKTVLNMAS